MLTEAQVAALDPAQRESAQQVRFVMAAQPAQLPPELLGLRRDLEALLRG